MKNFKQASKTIAIYFIGACISFTVLGLFASANASESEDEQKKSMVELCASSANLAKTIMEVRQNGGEMFKLLEVANGDELAEKIVIAAFDEPLYSTEEYKKRAAREFSNEVMLICMKSVNESR